MPASALRRLFRDRKRQTTRATPLPRFVSAERDGYVLAPKEREIHEKGLVSVLKQIHDELDAAVFDAYGWPHNLSDEEILERLVALNHERAEEEKRGLIRGLRPEFQNPAGGKPSVQSELALEDHSDDEESEESGSVADRPEQKKKGKGARSKTGPNSRAGSQTGLNKRRRARSKTGPNSAAAKKPSPPGQRNRPSKVNQSDGVICEPVKGCGVESG